MGKRLEYTPNTQIRNAVRKLFLQSRERRKCLKGAVCRECGSTDKLEAHHLESINWERIFAVLREEVLNDNMIPLCKACHNQETNIRKGR